MESFVEWGYLGLFVSSFLGATVIPFSSEVVFSLLIINGYDIKASLLVATVGNWLGGLSSYYLGRVGKWSTLEKYFKIKKLERLQLSKIDKWGNKLNCWQENLGYLAVSLGFFRINYISVAVWMFIGKVLRYLIWAAITFWGASVL